MKKAIEQGQKKQRGVVLAISLIVLVLITVLAMSGMRSTIMEERMASNSRNSNLAFQRAETALRSAEAALDAAANAVPTAKSEANGQANNIAGFAPGSCLVGLNSLDFHAAGTWGALPPAVPAVPCTVGVPGLDASKHRYFIEYFYGIKPAASVIGPCFYRVTARGYGDNQNSYATLQSTYKFTGCIL